MTSLSVEQLQGKVIKMDAALAEKVEENEHLKAENESLKQQLQALRDQLNGGGTSKVAAALAGAKATDAALNSA